MAAKRVEIAYDYRGCVSASEDATWKLDDIFPAGTPLSFEKHFLPDSLVSASSHTFLSDDEKKALNHISSHAYLNLFAFIEEFILAKIVRRAYAELFVGGRDHAAVRALCRFADEEMKHQELFARYRESFVAGFGAPAEVLERSSEVASVMLQKSAIAGMLLVLHVELMTQLHYTESVHGDDEIDPLFAHLLRAHWLEELQHTRIDRLELEKLVRKAKVEQIRIAVIEYLDLVDAFAGLLRGQAEMDERTLRTKIGRTFSEEESAELIAVRRHAYQRMFLAMGMTHPTFVEIVTGLDPAAAAQVAERASSFG